MKRWGATLAVLVGLVLGGDAAYARGTDSSGGSSGGRAEVVATAAGQQAKGNKKGKNANKKGKADKPRKKKDGIQVTGIKSFDRVFKEVGDIDRRLSHAENQLRSGRQNLNAALGLPKGTPFADALADLQNKAEGNLRLGLSGGGIPKLEATDAVPSNVQKAVDGFNGFTTNLTSSLDDVGQVSKDISHLVNATSKMPANLMQEFSKSSNGTIGLIEKLFILPKAIKNTTHNVKVVAGLDDRVSLLNHRIQDLVGTVQNSFDGPKTGKGKGNGGGNGKRKGKGKRGR